MALLKLEANNDIIRQVDRVELMSFDYSHFVHNLQLVNNNYNQKYIMTNICFFKSTSGQISGP